jgi:outer membrane lipoprotein-sorting protein
MPAGLIRRFPLLPLLGSALVIAASVAAESPRTEPLGAQQILDRMAEVYANCKSYRDSGVVNTLFIAARGNRTVEKPFTTAFLRPDRFRFEYKEKRSMGREPQYIVWRQGSDVRVFTDLRPGNDKAVSFELAVAGAAGVSSGSAHKIPSLLLPEIGGRRLTDITEAHRTDDGKIGEADCFRVEGKYADSPVTLWIDQASFLVRRVDMHNDLGKDLRTEETTTYEPVVDGEVSAEMLAFRPSTPN